LKNERTPLLSLSVCFLKLSPARAREEGREQMRRNREEEEEGNAREEGGVRTKTAPSSFALSEAFCVLYLSVGANRGSSFSPKGEQAQKKIEKKLAQAPKENFCDRRSLQNQTAPRRERRKEKEGSSSLRSQPHLSSFPFKTVRAHLLNPHL